MIDMAISSFFISPAEACAPPLENLPARTPVFEQECHNGQKLVIVLQIAAALPDSLVPCRHINDRANAQLLVVLGNGEIRLTGRFWTVGFYRLVLWRENWPWMLEVKTPGVVMVPVFELGVRLLVDFGCSCSSTPITMEIR